MNPHETKLTAIIDIGSTAIRLLIAEINPDKSWKTLEQASRSSNLGRDSFTKHRISPDTVQMIIRILKDYQNIIHSWQIKTEGTMVIATSALKEAENRDTVLDRIFVQTGLQIRLLSGIEANRLTYIAVEYALEKEKKRLSDGNSLIIEVGGGSTELILLQKNAIVAAHSLPIGTARVREKFKSSNTSVLQTSEYLTEQIRTIRERLDIDLELDTINSFIAVGNDPLLTADKTGNSSSKKYHVLDKENFLGFCNNVHSLSTDEIVHQMGIPYHMAELLSTSLEIYRIFLENTRARELIVPYFGIREGCLISDLDPENHYSDLFLEQMRASAIAHGRKYMIDERHARHVTLLALYLFDFLQKEFKMPDSWRIILEIAALLHDIGTFIHGDGHHKHGQYIIEHSELFGFSQDELKILGYIIRYHRKKPPGSSNSRFSSLAPKDRISILKITAILRVADALDRSHGAKIQCGKLHRENNHLLWNSTHKGDLAIERSSLKEKGNLFKEVFGLEIRLI